MAKTAKKSAKKTAKPVAPKKAAPPKAKSKAPTPRKAAPTPTKIKHDPSLSLPKSRSVSVRPVIAGNWKMNGMLAARAEVQKLVKQLAKLGKQACDVFVAPPATLIAPFAATTAKSPVMLGAQDCHTAVSGAFTGDLSPEMLKDAGATFVIVGHSERRAGHGERDDDVRRKADATLRAGLTPVVCVGESEAERDAGWTIDIVSRQIAGSMPDSATPQSVIVAYEPVWAIGTGRTPSNEDIRNVHAAIRDALVKKFGEDARGFRVLYGGSVKPSNAAEILRIPGVNGALVGGASLKADDFLAIIAGSPR